jgi:hypothetical protein
VIVIWNAEGHICHLNLKSHFLGISNRDKKDGIGHLLLETAEAPPLIYKPNAGRQARRAAGGLSPLHPNVDSLVMLLQARSPCLATPLRTPT